MASLGAGWVLQRSSYPFPCLGQVAIIREVLGLGGSALHSETISSPVWWYMLVIPGDPKLKATLEYALRACLKKQKTTETFLELFLGPGLDWSHLTQHKEGSNQISVCWGPRTFPVSSPRPSWLGWDP